MELRRTANAGFLLTLDGVTSLLDGVCLEVSPYQATPPAELARLSAAPPDLLAFTHCHADHFDPRFAASFSGPVIGPEAGTPLCVGGVRITPVPTRHIGKSCLTTIHHSFIMKGSRCVWFMGDAAPAQMALLAPYGQPDVLIAPFAYAATASAVRLVNEVGPKTLVLTHLPRRDNDPHQLWPAVEAQLPGFRMEVLIPELCESVIIK